MCPDVETPISQSFHCVSFHAACAKLTLNELKGKCKNEEGVIGLSKVVGDFTRLPASKGSSRSASTYGSFPPSRLSPPPVRVSDVLLRQRASPVTFGYGHCLLQFRH